MKKIELLCPAGNREMLEMAVQNGADAIYLSGVKFGARKFANNFTNEEIIDAINYAHLYGVKVYITINTLIKDNEVEEFLEYVEFIHKNNVDAVLMQDLGMIYLVKNMFPNLEIHASTQFHAHNIEDLKFLKNLGIKRAVLARELSLNEIKNFNVDIEKEIFVHGALCICYSGQCLMSSLILNRSGNRGECAGMCRLPYNLFEDDSELNTEGNYLLSTKELCTIENLNQILEADIDSIKIEGRMKSPEYVGYITKLYRNAIDNYYNNKEIKIDSKDIEKLKMLFNREFTKGYLFEDNNVINQKSPNHLGVEIGKVINITKDKIKIKLSKNIHQGDAIRFQKTNKGMYLNFIYNEKNKLINSAKENDVILLDNKINLKENDIVLKTIDILLIEEINNYPKKKIPIDINIEIKLNERIKIEFNDGINKIIEYGNVPDKALKQSLNKETITEKISKLGNSIYIVNNLNIELDDNVFIPIKELNELRRKAIESLNKERIKVKIKFEKQDVIFNNNQRKITKKLGVLIDNEEDYLYLKKLNNIDIYTDDIKLYKKYKINNNIFLRLQRVTNNINDFNNEKLLTSDIGSIFKYMSKNKLYADIYSNVTNTYTVKFLADLGVEKIGISPELSINEINYLYDNYKKLFNEVPNIEVFVYGKLELMILKHCVLKNNLNNNNNCNLCQNKKSYYLQDRNKEKYKIITRNCKNIILHYKTIDRLIKNSNITNYYVSLIGLNINEKNKIKNYIKEW